MTIPLKEEPKDLQEGFKLYEACYFKCGSKTKYWHLKSNQPVCIPCSKIHWVSELRKSSPKFVYTPRKKKMKFIRVERKETVKYIPETIEREFPMYMRSGNNKEYASFELLFFPDNIAEKMRAAENYDVYETILDDGTSKILSAIIKTTVYIGSHNETEIRQKHISAGAGDYPDFPTSEYAYDTTEEKFTDMFKKAFEILDEKHGN